MPSRTPTETDNNSGSSIRRAGGAVWAAVVLGALVAGRSEVAAAAEKPAQPLLEQVDLFEHQGQDWYRIPSIVVTTKGTVLAFASWRKGSVRDFGHPSDVVLRRSTDGGRTFDAMKTIVTAPNVDVHHGPSLVDRHTGRVFKFCRYWPAGEDAPSIVRSTPYRRMVELGYVDHFIYSDDDGQTWSKPKALVLPYPEGSLNAATGNGSHGIQLQDGRLLIQAGFSLEQDGKTTRHSALFFSDDHGRTWRLGAAAPIGGSLREFCMAETADGSVYFNVRSNRGHRAVSWSDDPTATFGRVADDPVLVDPFCHAGLIRCSAEETGGRPELYFSNPAQHNPGGGYSARHRRDLTVRVSFDDGRTWPAGRTIHRGPAAYSDLAALDDGTILCLYERGSERLSEKITLARLNLAWLKGSGAGGQGSRIDP
jgi:sialidase-1